MIICVEINTCADCRHIDNSGAFTKGGAKPICGHRDSVRIMAEKHPTEKDSYHWKFRVLGPSLDGPIPIPEWCPLKRGAKY